MVDLANKGEGNLVLIGFMGTGKTTVGKRVAASLNFEFVDTDEKIVERAGKPIPVIFESRGEHAFREIETEVLREACAEPGRVISTGGGVVTVEENHAILARGSFVIWLKTSPEIIYRRVCRNRDRPLLETADPEQTIRDLLSRREPLYEQCSDFTIVTDDLSLEETVYGVTETARCLLSGRWQTDS